LRCRGTPAVVDRLRRSMAPARLRPVRAAQQRRDHQVALRARTALSGLAKGGVDGKLVGGGLDIDHGSSGDVGKR
jgi:hypothetical protein